MDRPGDVHGAGTGAGVEIARLITVPARPECVRDARSGVAQFLEIHRVPSVVVEDLALVVSELVTNGVMYGVGAEVDVDIRLVGAPDVDVVIAVSNVGPTTGIPAVAEWQQAPPTATSGRGLGIVRRLVDDVAVRDGDRRATVVVRRHLPAGSVPIDGARRPDSIL